MRCVLSVVTMLFASTAIAQVVVPIKTIRAKEILRAEDLVVKPNDIAGAFSGLQDVLGKEARVVLYAGRPIMSGDIAPPAIVGRNDLIKLVFLQGKIRISTEGRALGRGSVGQVIKVMNMASRVTVLGVIMPNGSVEVQ